MPSSKDFDELETKTFILFGRSSAPENFSEGLSYLMFGYPIVKILLHTVREPKSEDELEIRTAQQYLTMPTVAAIQLADKILSSAKKFESRLIEDLPARDRSMVVEILKHYELDDSSSKADSSIAVTKTARPVTRQPRRPPRSPKASK